MFIVYCVGDRELLKDCTERSDMLRSEFDSNHDETPEGQVWKQADGCNPPCPGIERLFLVFKTVFVLFSLSYFLRKVTVVLN